MAKVYSIQPRFKLGSLPGGWAQVDAIFKMGQSVPEYGTNVRDAHLSMAWVNEPMMAGVLSTWVEKAQTVNWKIVGGRNNANYYATVLSNADNSWSDHEGMCALDYLTCDKGCFEELGRVALAQELDEIKKLTIQDVLSQQQAQEEDEDLTVGRVAGIQQIDSARIVKMGKPGFFWRYYPELGRPVDLPDENIIQIKAMPLGRDRFRGYGVCSVSRLIDAKNLMVGYLTYYRQEIGDLPPELVVIINGLGETAVKTSLAKYKQDREAAGLTAYGKIWWLGSDDPASKVELSVQSLTSPNKSFSYTTMIEWWIKLLALNTGEDVGEFWLLQSGESKTVQSIQAQKSRGKGVAKYLQEKERRYNMDVLPFGTRFEYDNTDDEQDKARADLLATEIDSLTKLTDMGVQRQELVFTIDEVRQMAAEWGVISPDMAKEEVPYVLGSTLKQAAEGAWVVDRDFHEYELKPLLHGREAYQAMNVYHTLKEMYSGHNGYSGDNISEMMYMPLNEFEVQL